MDEIRFLSADRSMRLDAFLAAETELSRARAQKLIAEGCVLLNGKAARASAQLAEGDSVRLRIPEPVETAALPEAIPLSIVYEDAELLVVDKPQGMVVHPAPGHASGTLVNALLYHVRDLSGVGGELRPGIVHRIDRMTSGLLVVAKNDASHQALAAQFKTHAAGRSYLALVSGNLREDAGEVRAPIGRHPTDRKRMAVCAGGREAETHWNVILRFGQYTLVRAVLATGRTHQIRVHMAYIKHPLAGDGVYGAPANALGLAGQALHGYRLFFTHPTTGEGRTFYSPLPPYFTQALARLGCAANAEEIQALYRT